jgi:hypothetical protein
MMGGRRRSTGWRMLPQQPAALGAGRRPDRWATASRRMTDETAEHGATTGAAHSF